MARVRMLTHVTGGRGDGTPWPPYGGVLECGDGEAADLVRARLAEPVADEPLAAPEPSAEPAEGDGTPGPEQAVQAPAARDAKQAWVDHAMTLGASAELASALTKADLIARYGQ